MFEWAGWVLGLPTVGCMTAAEWLARKALDLDEAARDSVRGGKL